MAGPWRAPPLEAFLGYGAMAREVAIASASLGALLAAPPALGG